MQTKNTAVKNRLYSQILASSGVRKNSMVFPIFIQEEQEKTDQVLSMPGMSKISMAKSTDRIQSIIDAGISSIIIFGIPKRRDKSGSCAANKNGIVQKALRKVKKEFGDVLTVITDVCVCQYNFSGHCGVSVNGTPYDTSVIDNDSTLDLLGKIALSHVDAGADIVAPSAMMDGQVYAIRNLLDNNGFKKIKIMSYSAKHYSSLYTPFRRAAFSTKIRDYDIIDKSSYQLSYSNRRQILREINSDITEGADMVMIRPAMAYLDLVCMIKEKVGFPIAVQNVSGEYAMIKAAAMQGLINEEEWKVNLIASIKRSGADKIISYFSMDIARYLTD